MRIRAAVLLAAFVVAPTSIVARIAFAGDGNVKQFKAEFEAAQSSKDPEKRSEAEVKALDHLKGATTVDAAQAALAVSLDANAYFKTHEAALDALRSMTGDAVRAWAAKEVASGKDARTRATLCAVVGSWKDAWKSLLTALKDKEGAVVAAAADALATVKEKDVVAGLVKALKDAKEPRTQDDLVRALKALTGLKLKDAGEWDGWWSSEGEKFSFDAAPAPVKPETPPSDGIPRTTSNGSGLYETISSNKVIFVIDTSYSMRITGEVQESASDKKRTSSRLEFCQKELCAAIEAQLSKKCFFNVIAYSTKVTPWKGKLQEANDANKKAAKAWVLALQPEDETNTYDALEAAFSDKQVDTIYLLTDGFPTKGKVTNMDTLRGEIRKWNTTRKIRINCICYVVGDGTKYSVSEDKGMSKRFMQALADENGGFCKIFDG